jgi:hypothetical protein
VSDVQPFESTEVFSGTATAGQVDGTSTSSTPPLIGSIHSDVVPGVVPEAWSSLAEATPSMAWAGLPDPRHARDAFRFLEHDVFERWRIALCEADTKRVGELVETAHAIRAALRAM